MIKFALVISAVSIIGCSSVQQQAFSLNTSEDYHLQDKSQQLKFETLCRQLSIIAQMNLLDEVLPPNSSQSNTECKFKGAETYSGYSFGFTYQTPEGNDYKNNNYPQSTSYSQKTIELSAQNNQDSIKIMLESSNQDSTFEKLSFLVDKLLKQEYNAYYEPKSSQKYYPKTYNDD
ncbi:hypothetical protein MED121_13570 [Marinomonas sp. MED121]|uniref:hypothetical protein n=1 Tax=Marinomonas sp. MED121 TaxID=314277 RepID=UPI000068FF3F|nr:hypothetical protein [Marinomonas sp. MED121]EAQ66960.1 hypothetical protein MED121_13570 [Marinomonas sp. MED121]